MTEERYRVRAFVGDSGVDEQQDMGFSTYAQIFTRAAGQRCAVVERPDGKFIAWDLWGTLERPDGSIIPPEPMFEADDADAAIMRATLAPPTD